MTPQDKIKAIDFILNNDAEISLCVDDISKTTLTKLKGKVDGGDVYFVLLTGHYKDCLCHFSTLNHCCFINLYFRDRDRIIKDVRTFKYIPPQDVPQDDIKKLDRQNKQLFMLVEDNLGEIESLKKSVEVLGEKCDSLLSIVLTQDKTDSYIIDIIGKLIAKH